MDTIKVLTTLPSTDGNFLSALNTASLAQLKYAVQIMKLNSGGQNSSRIKACESKIASLENGGNGKAKATPKKSKGKVASAPKEKAEPKPVEVTPLDESMRPIIVPFKKSEGNHTYEECEKKLKAELKKFTEDDSAYVVEGILERCRVDKDFCNNVMREDKSYEGFFKFMFKAAQNGYCTKVDNGGILSANQALGLAFDYFNGEEEKESEDADTDNENIYLLDEIFSKAEKKGTTFVVPNPAKKKTKTVTKKVAETEKKEVYEQLSLFD